MLVLESLPNTGNSTSSSSTSAPSTRGLAASTSTATRANLPLVRSEVESSIFTKLSALATINRRHGSLQQTDGKLGSRIQRIKRGSLVGEGTKDGVHSSRPSVASSTIHGPPPRTTSLSDRQVKRRRRNPKFKERTSHSRCRRHLEGRADEIRSAVKFLPRNFPTRMWLQGKDPLETTSDGILAQVV